jgi:toxin YoeB
MRQIKFEISALSELEDWVKIHPKTALKILDLLQEICKNPFEGKGKPEPLKHKYKGFWSRRITDEHRIIYEVTESHINVVSCKGHYD